MMKSILIIPLIALMLGASAQSQKMTGQLDIKLNKNIFKPGDSLVVTADYRQGGSQDAGGQKGGGQDGSVQNGSSQLKNQSLATLELIVENEEGQRTRLRWPMINGKASGAIFLPDSLPLGKYILL